MNAISTTPALSAKAWTLLFISTLTIMAGATIAPAMPAMKQAFAAQPNAEFWVKLLLTLPGLTIAVCAPFMGWLLDHTAKKRVMLLAVGSYALCGSAGYFVSDSLWWLLLSRALLGVAVAAVMVCSMTLAAAYFSGPAYARFAGKQAAFSSFGGVLFMALGGLIASLDWRSTFLIYAIAGLLLPAVIGLLEEPETHNSAVKSAANHTVLPISLIAGYYALAFLEIVLLYTIPVHYPFFATELGAPSEAFIGMAIATMLLAMALTALNYGRLHRGKTVRQMLCSGAICLGMGFVLLGFSQQYWHSFVGMVGIGIGFGLIRPTLMTGLLAITPPALRGRIMGGVTSCIFMGQFVSPLLSDNVFQQMGYSHAFLSVGCVVMTMLLVMGLFGAVLKRGMLYES